MSTPEERLAELGLEVPEVVPPVAAYVPAVRSGNQVFTSGQLPMRGGELMATGIVGADVTAEEAYACAQQCALNAIAAVKSQVGDLSNGQAGRQGRRLRGQLPRLHRPARRHQRRLRAARQGVRRRGRARPLGGRRGRAAAGCAGRGRDPRRGLGRREDPDPADPAAGARGRGGQGVRGRHQDAGRAARRGHGDPAAPVRAGPVGLLPAPPGLHGLRRGHVRLPRRRRRPARLRPRRRLGRPVAGRVGRAARLRRGARRAPWSARRSARRSRSPASCWPVRRPTTSSPTPPARTGRPTGRPWCLASWR